MGFIFNENDMNCSQYKIDYLGQYVYACVRACVCVCAETNTPNEHSYCIAVVEAKAFLLCMSESQPAFQILQVTESMAYKIEVIIFFKANMTFQIAALFKCAYLTN